MLGEAFGANSLVVRTRSHTCAISLEHVVETMRPLPIAVLRGAPMLVRGLSVVRGEPIPVIDLGALLGATRSDAPARFVVVRIRGRRAALAVDEVVGTRPLDRGALAPLSPLASAMADGALSGASGPDGELLLLLDVIRVVPDEVWALVDGAPA